MLKINKQMSRGSEDNFGMAKLKRGDLPHYYNHEHNILRIFVTLPSFFSSQQVKRSLIISNKHGIHELP